MKSLIKCFSILLVFVANLLLASVLYDGHISDMNGTFSLTIKLYTSESSEYPIWSETHHEILITDGNYNLSLGEVNPLIAIDNATTYYVETYIDGELTGSRSIIDFTESGAVLSHSDDPVSDGGGILEEMTPSLEIGNGTDDVIVVDGSDFGIGLAAGADATGRLEVRGDEVRVWDGSASVGYANGEGDIYIEDQLEVDNTIYASHYRDNTGNNLLNAGANIGIAEDADGSWTISNTGSDSDNQNLSNSISGNNVTINITGGTGTTFSRADSDADATNELQSLSISGHDVTLSDGGGTVTVPDNYNADNAPTATGRGEPTRNEIESWAAGVDDDNYADAVSVSGTTTKTITIGRTGSLADLTTTFTDNVNDADASTTNELQLLSISGHDVTLSDGGGTVTVPDNYNADNAPTATGRGEPTRNEIESWAAGVADVDWTISGSNIYRNTGRVGIGTTSPANTFHAEARDINLGQGNSVAFPSGSYGANIAIGGSHAITGGRGSTVIGWNNDCDDDFCSIIGVRSTISSGISGGYIFGLDNTVSAQDGFAIGSNVSNSIARSIQIGWNSSAGIGDLNIMDTGNIGIGTTSPSQKLHVQGNARITGGLYDSSGDVGGAGQVLSSTGSGTNWITPSTASGDITAVYAGNDLDGGASSGSATLHIEPTLDYVDYINNLYRVSMMGSNSYDKYRVWSTNEYAIGMYSGMSFGYLNDYAMTFTMNNDTDRGFVWRDVSDAQSDGAMSLTTDGRLTVKTLTSTPIVYDRNNTSYYWDGSGTTRENVHYNYGTFYMGSSATDGDDMYIADRIYDWDNTSYYLDPSSTSYLNDVRASIVYDRDNTSYYSNPASSSRFNTIYSYYVHPWSNSAYDLGSSSYRWRYAWINGIYLNGSYRNSWPSSGGSSQWTDAGSYLYGTEYSNYRWYESTSYWTYFSGDNNGTHKHYIYNSDNAGGSSYSSQRDNYYAYNYWGNTYSSSVFGNSYLDYNRAAGVMGYNSSDWGALAYQNASGTEYGGYFYGGYTGGSGFFARSAEGVSERLLAGLDGEAHIDNAIGAWGDLFGADIHGEVYGMFVEGGRLGQYTHGDRYTDGLDIHLVDGNDEQTHVTFTSRAIEATIVCDGSNSLVSGRANVEFPEDFKALTDNSKPITVTVTPIGDCNGVHLVNVNENGFQIAENSDGTTNIQFNWIAVARSIDNIDKIDLPQEVVDGHYAEKVKSGYYADGDLQREGNGLYFLNGELVDEIHSSTIPTEELIVLKNDFSQNPKTRTYQQWHDAFAAIGEEDMMMTESDYEAFIDTPEENPAFYDEYGVQIPKEWIEELRAEGVRLYSREETLERRKQDLIDTARARKEAEKNSTEQTAESSVQN